MPVMMISNLMLTGSIFYDWTLTFSRVGQGAYLEVEYIRNVLSVSGTLKYADSGTA